MMGLTEDERNFTSVPVNMRRAAPLVVEVDQNQGRPLRKCKFIQCKGVAGEHYDFRFQRRQLVNFIYPAPSCIGKKQAEIIDLPAHHLIHVDRLACAAGLKEAITASVWILRDN